MSRLHNNGGRAMTFLHAIIEGLKGWRNVNGYNGRACRSEYWYWMLFFLVIMNIAEYLNGYLLHIPPNPGLMIIPTWIGTLLLWPTINVGVRRLHDTDRTGWWFILVFSVIGILPLLAMLCTKGTEGENRFGCAPSGTSGLA